MFNIYLITNKINDKKYVGLTKFTIEKRWKDHITTAYRRKKKYAIHNAIKKYGEKSFEIILLESDAPKEREQYWIEYHDSYNTGYNLTLGGDGTSGWHPNEDQKKTISENTRLAHKEGRIDRRGTNQTECTKKKISTALIERYQHIPHHTLGRKHSEESIEKMKGRVVCEETKKKMSLAAIKSHEENHWQVGEKNGMFGKTHVEETKNIISEKAKDRCKNKKECIHCGRFIDTLNYSRWHGDNCKQKNITCE